MPVISGVQGFLIGVFNSLPPPVYLSDKMVCALAVIVGEFIYIYVYIFCYTKIICTLENKFSCLYLYNLKKWVHDKYWCVTFFHATLLCELLYMSVHVLYHHFKDTSTAFRVGLVYCDQGCRVCSGYIYLIFERS